MTSEAVLSPEELEQFEAQGLVRVTQAFDPDKARAMQHFMQAWRESGRKLNESKLEPIYKDIAGARMCGAINQLLDEGDWKAPETWGGFLVTPPKPEPNLAAWDVTAERWHIDCNPASHLERMNAVFIFTFFSHVKAGGGGTLGLLGSHRLTNRFMHTRSPETRLAHSARLKAFCKSQPYLQELTGVIPSSGNRIEKFMERETDVDGIPARVIEMTGAPGDAIICHPSLLHAVSMNQRPVARWMRVKMLNRLSAISTETDDE